MNQCSSCLCRAPGKLENTYCTPYHMSSSSQALKKVKFTIDTENICTHLCTIKYSVKSVIGKICYVQSGA